VEHAVATVAVRPGPVHRSGLGHAAANVDLFAEMAERMPGGSGAALEEQFFGSVQRPGVAARSAPAAWCWRRGPVRALAAAYAERLSGMDIEQITTRADEQHRLALGRLEARLGRARMLPARVLIRIAAEIPGWRGTGRASILRAVDVARAAARAVGDWLCEEGVLRRPDDVFLFTVELPQVWRGVPGASAGAAGSASAEPAVIHGLGVSSGSAEGIVAVVHDQDLAELDEDSVIVCYATDPSWASLFPLARAVVTDVGSSMSHAAIVCRELGVPCVANTRSGTSELRDGMRVRVDGDRGIVEVLTPAIGGG
jgi:phosphohistidine swiveling domain-containing protein